jgi:hypothetical protein
MTRFPELPGGKISVPSVYIGASGPWDLVKDRFEVTGAYASSAFAATESYITGVISTIQELEKWKPEKITVGDVETPDIDYNSRPTLGDLDLHRGNGGDRLVELPHALVGARSSHPDHFVSIVCTVSANLCVPAVM